MATKKTEKLAGDRDKLVADLKLLVEDAKTLTSDASAAGSEFAHEKAEHVRGQLVEVLEKLKAEGEQVRTHTLDTASEIEKAIKERPWQSIGIAILVGIVIDRFIRD